jgi:putative nucleotidyltransferase with HDIG domain
MRDLRSVLDRQRQLDALSSTLIIGLLIASMLLGYALLAHVDVTRMLLLQDPLFRALVVSLLLTFLLYLIDQGSRLRGAISERDMALLHAQESLQASIDRLTFAHHTAEIMTALRHEDAMPRVLEELAGHFDADVAALVGDDIALYPPQHVLEHAAGSDILAVATQCVTNKTPLNVGLVRSGSAVMAVPLRVGGRLQSVCALWRRDGDFDPDFLEGLVLVAKIMELGMENEHLLEAAHLQLRRTLRTLVAAAESRTGNMRRAAHVAELAMRVAERLGLDSDEREDLRAAALLHDVGMLELPDTVVHYDGPLGPRSTAELHTHPERGARIAHDCGFGTNVQEAIRAHHERPDGTGYPRGVRGDSIPLAARIIAACDGWDEALTGTSVHPAAGGPDGEELPPSQLSAYDPAIVQALFAIHNGSFGDGRSALRVATLLD